jgi:hypothetical protein
MSIAGRPKPAWTLARRSRTSPSHPGNSRPWRFRWIISTGELGWRASSQGLEWYSMRSAPWDGRLHPAGRAAALSPRLCTWPSATTRSVRHERRFERLGRALDGPLPRVSPKMADSFKTLKRRRRCLESGRSSDRRRRAQCVRRSPAYLDNQSHQARIPSRLRRRAFCRCRSVTITAESRRHRSQEVRP